MIPGIDDSDTVMETDIQSIDLKVSYFPFFN